MEWLLLLLLFKLIKIYSMIISNWLAPLFRTVLTYCYLFFSICIGRDRTWRYQFDKLLYTQNDIRAGLYGYTWRLVKQESTQCTKKEMQIGLNLCICRKNEKTLSQHLLICPICLIWSTDLLYRRLELFGTFWNRLQDDLTHSISSREGISSVVCKSGKEKIITK